jgi:hypothetical protein
MIQSTEEYQKAQDELRHLEGWLNQLRRSQPTPAKGQTKAGVLKMIARLHEELAVYEGGQEIARLEPST